MALKKQSLWPINIVNNYVDCGNDEFITSFIKIGGNMLPGDYKRKYRFRSDTSQEKKYIRLATIISIIIMIVLALLMYRPFGL